MSCGNIHLEFYGLPGCGKTTISALVAKHIEISGHIVKCASAETGSEVNPLIRRVIKLRRTISYYFRHRKNCKAIKEIVRQNGYVGKRESVKQYVNVVQKLYYYSDDKNDCVFIWDEGLTQVSVSLSVKGAIPARNNEENLLHYCSDRTQQIKIYIKEDIETVIERMAKRKSNDSRVEKIHDTDEKISLLSRFKKECDTIEPQIVIEGKGKTPVAISEEICSALKRMNLFERIVEREIVG